MKKYISDNGYITISDLVEKFNSHYTTVCKIIKLLNIDITYDTNRNWSCIKLSDINSEFENAIKVSKELCRSIAENEIYEYIKDLCPDTLHNVRNIINPKELDIYIPSKKIAIEFDGLYWHKNKNDLYIKTDLCELLDITLIHIYEDEWEYNKSACLSLINNILGFYDKEIYISDCNIIEINENIFSDFIKNNTLELIDYNNSLLYGIFNNDELVEVLKINKETGLLNIIYNLKYLVINDSKLVNFIRTLNINNLHLILDRRFINIRFANNLYLIFNFDSSDIILPSFYNIINGKHTNIIKKDNMNTDIIYNCGYIKFFNSVN